MAIFIDLGSYVCGVERSVVGETMSTSPGCCSLSLYSLEVGHCCSDFQDTFGCFQQLGAPFW